MVFFYVPEEETMGAVQRIFYFHISSASVAFLAFFLVMIGSVMFLLTRHARWDILAHASAEIGTLFWAFVLLSGAFWAKPAWNVWWPWGDLGLLTALILWLLYVGYLILRYDTEGKGGAIYVAFFGILAFIGVPAVYFSVRWWQTTYPASAIADKLALGAAPEMLATLKVSLVTFLCLFVYLLQQRVVMGLMQVEIDKIRRSIAERHVQYGFLVENQNFVVEEYNIEEYKKL